jgi:outer membrane protein OmpA-like peptidoglycan-associated protein
MNLNQHGLQEAKMKRIFLILVSFTLITGLVGCSEPLSKREKGAGIGAVTGAALGGLIGAAAGSPGIGAGVGAAVGTAGGYAVGDYMMGQDKQQAETQRQIDQTSAELQRNAALIEELKRQNIEARQSDRGVIVNLPAVLFQFNSAALSPGGRSKVQQIATIVEERAPGRRLSVEGHASLERADQEAYNQQLSERRAQTVANQLAADGINGNQIQAQGLGTRYPVASNDTPQGREQNRRVEVVIEN